MSRSFRGAAFAAAIALMAVATPALGDFATGLDACKRGDYAATIGAWRPLADAGNPQAQYMMGMLYAQGVGITRNYALARDWYEKAATAGLRAAQFSLGWLYYHGGEADAGSVAIDRRQAARWLTAAADAGQPMASYIVGRMHLAGAAGLPADEARACALLVRAAEGGVAMAQYDAGSLLAAGRGCARDDVAAYTWFLILAAQGYPGAARNLEIMAAKMDPAERLAAEVKADAFVPQVE